MTQQDRQASDLALAGKSILAVDDIEVTLTMVKSILEMEGAKVTTAANGKIAYTLASNDCFDVILMDVQMPVWDGPKATRELRACGISTPIIALTAASEHEKPALMEAGIDDFHQKPVDFASLIAIIQQWSPSNSKLN